MRIQFYLLEHSIHRIQCISSSILIIYRIENWARIISKLIIPTIIIRRRGCFTIIHMHTTKMFKIFFDHWIFDGIFCEPHILSLEHIMKTTTLIGPPDICEPIDRNLYFISFFRIFMPIVFECLDKIIQLIYFIWSNIPKCLTKSISKELIIGATSEKCKGME